MNSWFNDIYDNLNIKILIENNIRISSAGWAVYTVFMTSAIFYNSPLILNAYLSYWPE